MLEALVGNGGRGNQIEKREKSTLHNWAIPNRERLKKKLEKKLVRFAPGREGKKGKMIRTLCIKGSELWKTSPIFKAAVKQNSLSYGNRKRLYA